MGAVTQTLRLFRSRYTGIVGLPAVHAVESLPLALPFLLLRHMRLLELQELLSTGV